MAEFKNFSEMLKHYNSPSNANKLKAGAVDSNVMRKALQNAALNLRDILHKHINDYYMSYEPSINPRTNEPYYKRTGLFQESVQVSAIEDSQGEMRIRVYFDQELATHPSIFGGEPGFLPILLNEGWTWHNPDKRYHLSWYEGFHFVEKAIDEFNAIKNPYRFKIIKETTYGGMSIDRKVWNDRI